MKDQKPFDAIPIKTSKSPLKSAKAKIEGTHKNFKMSDAFYKQLVDSLNDYCVFTTDKKGVISSWNSGAEKLLGYSEKEIIGQNISIIYTVEDRRSNMHKHEMNTAKATGRADDIRWHVKKNKKQFWGSGLVFPLKDEKNRLLGFTKIMQDLTESKTKELQLKESETFSKSIFNSSPDSVKVLELNGNLITINEAGIKMMEIDDVNVHIGKLWFHFWDDQYSRDLKKAILAAKKGGIGRFQGSRPTMKGTYKWWDVSVSPIINSKGKIIQLLSVSRDITEAKIKEEERKNLNDELIMEKTKLIEIFKDAPSFISIVKGKDFVFEFANDAYFKLVGRQDVVGKTVLECFPEVKEQGVTDLLTKVYTTGVPFTSKVTKLLLYDKSKKRFVKKYVDFVYQPTRDKMGVIDGVAANGYDITEQVEARKYAEELGVRFETMANNIPNLAWIADESGWIVWYNQRWYEYTGTTPKDMEGWGWKSVHDPEKLPEVLKEWELSITSGQPFEMVFPLKGGNNIFRPFLTRVTPIRNDAGKIIRWFGTNTDITKQKALERIKEDFLGIASHELKTPVTVIKAYTQVLEEMFKTNGDAKAAAWLGKMNGQVNKLTDLINDLLDVTNIQSGKLQFKNAIFNFNDLVTEITEQIQGTAPNHRIEINLDKSIQVNCDRERLGQVIINFLTNAIKYSPKADIIIVSTKVKKGSITLSIKDFGVGISKDQHSKVFEQFYRVGDNQQYTFPGIGLGLYISAQIINRLKGKIWVESEVGKGSEFCFSIPTVTDKAGNKN